MSYDNVKLARQGYEAFARGEIQTLLEELFDPDLEWVQAEVPGMPFSGTERGAAAVVANVFAPIVDVFHDFSVEPQEYVEAGDDRVLVLGRIRARTKSGHAIDEAFADVLTFREGRLVRYEAHTNTAAFVAALSPVGDNEATLCRAYEILAGGNLDDIDDIASADFVDHNPEPGQAPGLAGVKETFRNLRSGIPDLKIEVQEVWGCGDKVVARARVSGTQEGALGDLPATGKQFEVDVIDVVRFEDGKGVERWGVMDQAAMLQQLGMIPG